MVSQVAADLAGDFDVIDMLTTLCERLTDVIGIDAGGILLADGEGVEVATVSGGDVQEVEFIQLQIEQAKGVIARDRGIDVGEAFTLLRGTARRRRVKPQVQATDIVEGWMDPADVG